MKNLLCIVVLAVFGVVFAVSPAHADAKADAKAVIEKQVELIKKGDVDGLKAGFTKRLQDRITKDNVAKAAKQAAKMTIDDLVHAVEAKGDSIKIKMKNGRTLTTLVKQNGSWLADTVWFK